MLIEIDFRAAVEWKAVPEEMPDCLSGFDFLSGVL
jgi:hypothetical protein